MTYMNSIIVYRNPLEQWFWEGDGALIVLGLLLLLVAYMQVNIWWRNWRIKRGAK